MIRQLTIAIVFLASATSAQSELLVTGRIESAKTQRIITPLTNTNQQQITYLADEGTQVQIGDVVARFDGTQADSQFRAEEEALISAQAQADKNTAQLALDLDLAETDHEQAKIRFELAKIEAAVPANVIGELDYSENQLALVEAEDDLAEAEKKLAIARQRVVEKAKESRLDLDRKQARLDRWTNLKEDLEITAAQSGVVLHGSHPWTGNKFQAGDQAQSGLEIASISDLDKLIVVAWLNAVDLPKADLESGVVVHFDALPGISLNGEIMAVDQAGSAMPQWGDALYYRVEVSLNSPPANLLPGMSALVRVQES